MAWQSATRVLALVAFQFSDDLDRAVADDSDSPLSSLEQEIQTTFQQAVAHHQMGQMQEAGNLYQAILQIQPDHPGQTAIWGLWRCRRKGMLRVQSCASTG